MGTSYNNVSRGQLLGGLALCVFVLIILALIAPETAAQALSSILAGIGLVFRAFGSAIGMV